MTGLLRIWAWTTILCVVATGAVLAPVSAFVYFPFWTACAVLLVEVSLVLAFFAWASEHIDPKQGE